MPYCSLNTQATTGPGQFVEMTRLRIEGLLGAFTKLVDSGKDHTFAANLVLMWVFVNFREPQIPKLVCLLILVLIVPSSLFVVSLLGHTFLPPYLHISTLLCRSKMASDC